VEFAPGFRRPNNLQFYAGDKAYAPRRRRLGSLGKPVDRIVIRQGDSGNRTFCGFFHERRGCKAPIGSS
jgi:hypothetical protein